MFIIQMACFRISDGGGEKKYPTSSFLLNCKGMDFCVRCTDNCVCKINILSPYEFSILFFINKLMWLFAGDACTGDVVMFEQNVYEM